MTGLRPHPVPDTLTSPYWAAARENELVLQRCSLCRHDVFPPLSHCPSCRQNSLEWVPRPKTGTLRSKVRTHSTVVAGIDAPYWTGWVEVDETTGIELVGFLEADDASIGDRVVIEFEEREGVWSLVFDRVREGES